jgi:hypothetical protein
MPCVTNARPKPRLIPNRIVISRRGGRNHIVNKGVVLLVLCAARQAYRNTHAVEQAETAIKKARGDV